MIDLHNHLMPAVDDGSRTVAQSVGVLQAFAAKGITDVCLTPHFVASKLSAGIPAAHEAAFAALKAAGPPDVQLHRGAELMLDRPIAEPEALLRRLSLNGTRYLLVEFPRMVAVQTVHQALSHVVLRGFVPVLAHPERYACCTPEAAKWWKSTGSLMQVDATTLLAARGRGERARALVTAGLADISAADNHGDDRTVAATFEALAPHGGTAQAELLTTLNPRAILEDREVEVVPPVRMRASVMQRIRRIFDAEEM
ncbi:MAG: CpsB/CapC family capsule biosynthesis tyrosine phosphatase [Gemmatimonadota bacterium]